MEINQKIISDRKEQNDSLVPSKETIYIKEEVVEIENDVPLQTCDMTDTNKFNDQFKTEFVKVESLEEEESIREEQFI